MDLPKEFARKRLGGVFLLLLGSSALVLGALVALGVIAPLDPGPTKVVTEEMREIQDDDPTYDPKIIAVGNPSIRRELVRTVHHYERSWWSGGRVVGLVVVALAIGCLYVSIWTVTTPYGRVWHEGLRVYINPWRTERVYWAAVKGVEFRDEKVILELPGRDTLEISMWPVVTASRKGFVEAVRGLVADRNVAAVKAAVEKGPIPVVKKEDQKEAVRKASAGKRAKAEAKGSAGSKDSSESKDEKAGTGAAGEKKMRPRRVALQMYSVRELAKKDLAGTLKEVASAGYSGVEMGVPKDMSDDHLKKLLDDLGLIRPTGYGPVGTEEEAARAAEAAKLYGYGTIVSGLPMSESETLEKIEAQAARLAKTAELLKPHGLKVAFHNHWGEFDHEFGGRTPHRIVMDASPDICAEVDTYWAAVAGADVPAVLRSYGARCPVLHIKDGPIDDRKAPHTAVGSGAMDWPKVMAAVDDATEWFIVELDHCATDMMEAVRKSVEFLVKEGYGASRA
ncbi:MAG: sugar phosphate isomerase/epimerase family protein [Planctomycetota bacterium]|jgi:sugar phosphate isomerase/epimerase